MTTGCSQGVHPGKGVDGCPPGVVKLEGAQKPRSSGGRIGRSQREKGFLLEGLNDFGEEVLQVLDWLPV